VQIPIELLEACADKKGTTHVYGWLWHYAGRDDHAFPSVDRLALECRMKPDHVRASLRWLSAEGWIERIDRLGQTTLYHVRSERINPSPKRGSPPPKGGSPKRGTPPLPQTGDPTPPPNGGPNKKHLTRTREQDLEPPLPPAPGGALDPWATDDMCHDRDGFLIRPCPSTPPAAAQPQPQQPVPPWGPVPATEPRPAPEPEPTPEPTQPAAKTPRTAKPRAARFTPTADDIPAALLPVQAEILAFWPESSGKKSQIAWNRLMGQLQKIQDDSQGGTAILKDQLEQGAADGWKSITHSNWERFGKKASATPISGSGFRGRHNPDEQAAAAVAFIRERDRRRTMEQEGSLALLAEVI